MKYFFTADQHYGHAKILGYCNRPFKNIVEMDNELIKRHNEVVGQNDVVVHIGDFAMTKNKEVADNYIHRLKGNHIFLRGSHDYWMDDTYHEIWAKLINGIYVVCCHYQMTNWPRSHYGSVQLYGHSHGKSKSNGRQMDVGVDCNDFFPVEFGKVIKLVE